MRLRASGHAPEVQAREQAAARAQCARWGCGTGTPTQDFVLRSVAEAFGTMMACETPAGVCPFEGVYRGDGWPQELQGARVLVADDHLPWIDALRRPLTAVDVDALMLLKRAENVLDGMKRDEDEQTRRAREKR